MIKLNTLIIDDEPLAHEVLVDYLAELPFIEIVGQCYSAIEALNFLKEHPVDLLLLDISMPKLSGIELLKVLENKPLVIITSAHQQYALESFELDVCDYLLKPFRFERFLKAVNKAHHLHQLTHAEQIASKPAKNETTDSIFIKVGKQLIQLAIKDIAFFEAYGNYVKVWLGDECHLTARTLLSFEQELVSDNGQFIRIHKSYIVQKQHIHRIENRTVHMRNQQSLPIGKSFKHLANQLNINK